MTRKTSKAGIDMITRHEGMVLFAYLDQVGLSTIGVGHLCRSGDWYLRGKSPNEIQKMIKADLQYMSVSGHSYKVPSNSDVKNLTAITKGEAKELLKKDLAHAENAVLRLIKVPLTDNQFAALVSFTFNLGSGALQRSALRRKVNSEQHDFAAREFEKWVFAGGRKLKGLIKRRGEEAELYAAPDEELNDDADLDNTDFGDMGKNIENLVNDIDTHNSCNSKWQRFMVGFKKGMRKGKLSH